MRGTFLVILVMAFLIFGCTGTGSTNVKTDTSVNAGANTGNPAGNNGTTPPAGNSPPSKNDVSANISVTTDTGGLIGLGYTQLLALGVPIQCDVTNTYKGKTTKMRLYLQGKNAIRIEIPNTGAEGSCSSSVMIMKDKKVYTSCTGSQVMPGCDWLEIEANESAQGGAGGSGGSANTGASETPEFTDVPATQFKCDPWVYDSAKLTVTGKVCSLTDILNNIKVGGNVNIG
ncbi:hypothetical protein HY988_05780 [Candidatus Micrarchaeota archaeon]|nr:hypothetical protein [Candidatus Micrarchaeota archaeon]